LTVSHTADLQLMRASLLLESDPAVAACNAVRFWPALRVIPKRACCRLPHPGDSVSPKNAVAALECGAPEDRDTPFMRLELGRAYAASGCYDKEFAAGRCPTPRAATR
jgi:hypothetical protein